VIRREFLKILSAVPVVAAFPWTLSETKDVEKHKLVREIMEYSLQHDAYISRYDVIGSAGGTYYDTQLEISMIIPVEDIKNKPKMQKYRNDALKKLYSAMKEKGLTFSSLKPLGWPILGSPVTS
jgi:hypothetical protein